jgi:nuclear pore complex protein Nup205
MAATFVPSHFEKLHRMLKDSIASPARIVTSNEWYLAIERSIAQLVELAHAKKPSDAEKREIQSGECPAVAVASFGSSLCSSPFDHEL